MVVEVLSFMAVAAAGGAFLLSMFNARMLAHIQHQTNSMQIDMSKMARIIALTEGNTKGRADLLQEQ